MGTWGGGGGGHYSYNDYLRVKHFNEETFHSHVFKKKKNCISCTVLFVTYEETK